jgi:hypothetical protein
MGFLTCDLFATKIVMQLYLDGCSMLPSWWPKTEFPVPRMAWNSIYEAEISIPDQFLT